MKEPAFAKREAVKALGERFAGTKDFFLADYRGMTVEQMTGLRRQLRQEGAGLCVVKNRYAKLVFSEMGVAQGVASLLVGPTAVIMVKGDVGPIAKVLTHCAGETSISVKGGVVDGVVFDAIGVGTLAKLPSRTTLIQSLMGTILAPLQAFARTIRAVPEKAVRVLKALEEKQRDEEE